jgi:hypothetical protein
LLPWVAALIATLTAFGVFALPWLVPVQVREIVSESQMLGFNNRVAVIAMGIGVGLAGFLGLAWRYAYPERFQTTHPGTLAQRENAAEDRVDWRVAAILMGLTAAIFLGLAQLYGRYPTGDSAYFVDRLFQLINGGRFYQDFEFAYGPLLLFPTYWAWLAVRSMGVEIFSVYYAFAVATHVLGIAMAVYLANRLRIPRGWKHALVLMVFAFDVFMANLGMNYSPVRYLTPFVLLVWALQSSRKGVLRASICTVIAIAVTFAVSPEMGVAAALGLFVAFVMWALRRERLMFVPAAISVAVGLAGWMLYSSWAGSTFVAFGQGVFYMPVLPGQPALVFAATMLALAWAVGVTSDFSGNEEMFVQAGWFVASYVLIPAALGRADFGHLFWNGLGAIMLTVAVLYQVSPRLTAAFFSAAFVVYVFCAFAVTSTLVPDMYASGVRNGVIGKRASMRLATRLNRSAETGRQWYNSAELIEPTKADVAMLVRSGSVVAPFFLQGRMGLALAQNRALVPTFVDPQFVALPGQLDALEANMDKATYILIPASSYDYLVETAKLRPDSQTSLMRRPLQATSPGVSAILQQFPLQTHYANPGYEPVIALGRYLDKNWVVEKHSGDYVILRKKR